MEKITVDSEFKKAVQASNSSKLSKIKSLYARGAKLEGDGIGSTPLIAAINAGQTSSALLLLELGADVGAGYKPGELKPLTLAVLGRLSEVVDKIIFIIKQDPTKGDINSPDNMGRVAIYSAAEMAMDPYTARPLIALLNAGAAYDEDKLLAAAKYDAGCHVIKSHLNAIHATKAAAEIAPSMRRRIGL